MASAILRALEAETPSAATLNAARAFLNDNGVTLEVLRAWRRGPGFDPSTLPTFNDDPDAYENGDTPAEVNPLRTIAPFAPTDAP